MLAPALVRCRGNFALGSARLRVKQYHEDAVLSPLLSSVLHNAWPIPRRALLFGVNRRLNTFRVNQAGRMWGWDGDEN